MKKVWIFFWGKEQRLPWRQARGIIRSDCSFWVFLLFCRLRRWQDFSILFLASSVFSVRNRGMFRRVRDEFFRVPFAFSPFWCSLKEGSPVRSFPMVLLQLPDCSGKAQKLNHPLGFRPVGLPVLVVPDGLFQFLNHRFISDWFLFPFRHFTVRIFKELVYVCNIIY